MPPSNFPLYFILDDETDLHYTDILTAMKPDHFTWYWLRCRHNVQNILFCGAQDDSLQLKAFDPASARLLQQVLTPPTKFFSFLGKNDSCGLTQAEIAANLLKTLNADDSDKTVLVFTHEAFACFCRSCSAQSQKHLEKFLQKHSASGSICIRLPSKASDLVSFVTGDYADCPLLADAYKTIRSAADTGREERPLFDVLTELLRDQLLHFGLDSDEMRNLLLMLELQNAASADSLEQLLCQAEYLAVCRRCHTGPLAVESATDCFGAIPRRRLEELLRNPDFRERVRTEAAALRQKYPYLPIEAAMSQTRHLRPAHPVYDDNLSNQIRSLTLPEVFLRHPKFEAACWAALLEQIQYKLTTIWNKPRNSICVQAAKQLCVNAQVAISDGVWETLDAALRLLQFFSAQICAPAEQSADLKKIQDQSGELIKTYNYLYGNQLLGFQSDYTKFIDQAKRSGDAAFLKQIEFTLDAEIKHFGEDPESAATVIAGLEEDRARNLQKIEKSLTNAGILVNQYQEHTQQMQEHAAYAHSELEYAGRYTLSSGAELTPETPLANPGKEPLSYLQDLENFEQQESAPVQDQTFKSGLGPALGECTDEDRRFAQDLLKHHHMDWD